MFHSTILAAETYTFHLCSTPQFWQLSPTHFSYVPLHNFRSAVQDGLQSASTYVLDRVATVSCMTFGIRYSRKKTGEMLIKNLHLSIMLIKIVSIELFAFLNRNKFSNREREGKGQNISIELL